MKKILFAALLSMSYALISMENQEKTFPEEEMVETEKELSCTPGSVICWNYYNGEHLKHFLYPQLNILIGEHTDTIILRKLGARFLTLYKKNSSEPALQPVTRYAKAVCWRLLGDKTMAKQEISDCLERAERQVPINHLELAFILAGSDNELISILRTDWANTPHANQRKHLNNHLKNIKKLLEASK